MSGIREQNPTMQLNGAKQGMGCCPLVVEGPLSNYKYYGPNFLVKLRYHIYNPDVGFMSLGYAIMIYW